MAIIKCPECQKDVSSTAISCPHCGFAVKYFYDEKLKKEIEHQSFLESNKKLSLDGDSWYTLFDVYNFMINRITEATKELPKFRIVRFDNEFHSPLGFTNELFTLLEGCYHDIIKNITKEMGSFSNLDVRKNVTAHLPKYNYVNTMRTILARWSNLVNTPFDRQYSAVLEKAEYNYSMDIIKESEMGYGVITNSFTTMALYSLHSSIKESNAKYKAEINKQNYVNNAVNNIQNNIVQVWVSHFEELLNDIDLLHQLIIFEIGQVIFDGYFFDWFMVDCEFSKPENLRAYKIKRKKIDCEINRTKKEKSIFLQQKRNEYIEKQCKIITNKKSKLVQYQNELNALGIALLGDKAKKKKELQIIVSKMQQDISLSEEIINASIRKNDVKNSTFIHIISPKNDGYTEIGIHDICTITYQEEFDLYEIKDEDGKRIEFLPTEFNVQYGAFREFIAKLKSHCTSFQNNIPYQTEIRLSITSVD